jgi:hypothetical protein
MIDFIKRNKITVIILLATLILGGIAIFTAVRLYSLRSQRVAPTAPESVPGAAAPTLTNNCNLSFSTSVTVSGCDEPCTEDADCTETDQFCHDSDGDGVPDSCRLTDYPDEEDCLPPEVPTACNDECTTDAECEDVNSNYICYDTDDSGDLRCRDEEYPDEDDCTPPGESPTPTPTPTPTPGTTATPTPTAGATATPAAGLPAAGVSTPTVIGIGTAVILLVGALAIVL